MEINFIKKMLLAVILCFIATQVAFAVSSTTVGVFSTTTIPFKKLGLLKTKKTIIQKKDDKIKPIPKLIISPRGTVSTSTEHYNDHSVSAKDIVTNKVCLSGKVVSIYDLCKKICSNGEVINETLECKVDIVKDGSSFEKYITTFCVTSRTCNVGSIRYEQAYNRLGGTGLYSTNGNVFSPDQIHQIYNSADSVYFRMLKDIGENDFSDEKITKNCSDYYIKKQTLENKASENGVSLSGEFGDALRQELRGFSGCN